MKSLFDLCSGTGTRGSCPSNDCRSSQVFQDFDLIKNHVFNANSGGYFAHRPKSADAIFCDSSTNVSFIEIKEANVSAVTTYRRSIQEKLIDSLFILHVTNPTARFLMYVICVPVALDSAKRVRVKRMLRTGLFRTVGSGKTCVDDSTCTQYRSRKLTDAGKSVSFCYVFDTPTLKTCDEVNQMFS